MLFGIRTMLLDSGTVQIYTVVITSAKEDIVILVVCLFVCVSVSKFAQKLPNGFA